MDKNKELIPSSCTPRNMILCPLERVGVKYIETNYITSIPPMQKSTISTHINQDDMKKNNSTRKVDAVMTKMMAPFVSMFTISLSESSLAVSAFEDS